MKNRELLYALIISHISGDISDEDQTSLNKILAESEDARKMYDEMCSVLMTEEASMAIEGLSCIPPDIPVDKPDNPPRYWIGIAAEVFIILVIGYFMTNGKPLKAKKVFSYDSKKIQLIFGDGQSLVLNRDTTAVISGIRLSNSNGILRCDVNKVYDKIHSTDTRQFYVNYGMVSDIDNVGRATLYVPAGKHYNMILSDGTKVYLNAATSIKFPLTFNAMFREVSVDGEAFFEVTKDKEKPFIVRLPRSTVQVLGTTFNVNNYDKKEIVSLVTGKVNVLTENDTIMLKPSTEVVMQQGARPKVGRFSIANILGQKDGLSAYYNIRLDELANYIKRCYAIEVKIQNPVRNKMFYGAIDQNEPIRDFLNELTDTNKELSYSLRSDTLYIINK